MDTKTLFSCYCFCILYRQARAQINDQNCFRADQSGLYPSGEITCNTNQFSVSYADMPPYLHYMEENGRRLFIGVVLNSVKDVVARCCGSSTYICMDTDQLQPRMVEEQMLSSHQIAFPVVKSVLTHISGVTGYKFYPVMETQGSIVIRKTDREANVLASALAGTWPLAFVVLFTAGIAGIMIWLLDRYWNPSEFPGSFLRGGWEGTWWAFVTMTTVGYGDRAPKSIPARIFGLLWMFAGIVLMSIFTATLTTALSADTQQLFSLKGSKIGVVRGTVEWIIGYRIGAKITEYNTIPDLLDAINKNKEDAALLDVNTAMSGADIIADSGNLKTDNIIHNSAVYGFILQNQNTEIEQCFGKYTSKQMFKTYDQFINFVGSLEQESETVARDTSSDLISPSPLAMGLLAGAWGIAVAIGVLWELLYYRPKLRRQSKIQPDSDRCDCART